MKRNSFKLWLILLIATSTWSSANSQEQADSLTRYLTIAARHNPEVLQKFYEFRAALEKVPQVGSLPDPEFSLGVFIKPMELVNGKQVADLRLMQEFPWFGTLKAAKDEMSLMAKAKHESFREARLEVFYNVTRTWNMMQRLQQEIKTSEENLGILKTIERLTQVKFSAAPAGTPGPMQQSGSMPANPIAGSLGGSGLADLYRVQIEEGELENNIALLRDQLTTATAKFNSYLNRGPLTPVSLPGKITPDSLGLSLLAVTDSMLSNNPMLWMLHDEQQSLDARKRMVTRMGYPMIGLGLNYSVITKSDMSVSPMNGKDMIMPMLSLTLPVYRNKYRAMKAETEMLKSASEQQSKATSNALQTDYYEAVQLFQDGKRRMILYNRQGDLAEKTLAIMLKGFSTSGTPLTDILRIRQQTLDYELKEIEAVADYNTAIAWLQRLMAKSPVQ